jgi:uncharacterized protein YndB with AHSA1/START domain
MKKTMLKVEPGKQEVFIYREFDAPRELVFKAFTDPKLFAQWFKPCNMTLHLDSYDSVSGGNYQFTQTDAAGRENRFRGVFHDVTAPERLIRTFEYLNLPERGHVVLETLLLEALPGNRTRMSIQSVFQSVGDRDGMVQSGMENGASESFQLLEDFLEKLIARNMAIPTH